MANTGSSATLKLSMSYDEAQLIVDNLRFIVATRIQEAVEEAKQNNTEPEFPLEIADAAEQIQQAFFLGRGFAETLGTAFHWSGMDADVQAPKIPAQAVEHAQQVIDEIKARNPGLGGTP